MNQYWNKSSFPTKLVLSYQHLYYFNGSQVQRSESQCPLISTEDCLSFSLSLFFFLSLPPSLHSSFLPSCLPSFFLYFLSKIQFNLATREWVGIYCGINEVLPSQNLEFSGEAHMNQISMQLKYIFTKSSTVPEGHLSEETIRGKCHLGWALKSKQSLANQLAR